MHLRGPFLWFNRNLGVYFSTLHLFLLVHLNKSSQIAALF
jgi:hypothetical protein